MNQTLLFPKNRKGTNRCKHCEHESQCEKDCNICCQRTWCDENWK